MPAKPPEYVKLILAIERQLDSDPAGLMEFRDTCQRLGHMPAFKLDEKRAHDVIHRLERKLIVGPDKFEQFVDILKIVDRVDVIRMLPGRQNYGMMDGDGQRLDRSENASIKHEHYQLNKMDDVPCDCPNDIPATHLSNHSKSRETHLNEREIVTDLELQTLSDDVRPGCELQLGINLGIPYPMIENYMRSNRLPGAAGVGTFDMLVYWKKNVSDGEQRSQLVRALQEAELPDLVRKVLGADGDISGEDNHQFSRSSIVSEKHLCKLAGRIGSEWWAFGIEHLDMKQKDIDRFKTQANGVMTSCIFNMLYTWNNRQPEKVTVGRLIDLLDASDYINHESYQFILQELQSNDGCSIENTASESHGATGN